MAASRRSIAEHEPAPKPLTIVLPPVLDETAELPAVSPSAAPVLALPGPAPGDAQAPRWNKRSGPG